MLLFLALVTRLSAGFIYFPFLWNKGIFSEAFQNQVDRGLSFRDGAPIIAKAFLGVPKPAFLWLPSSAPRWMEWVEPEQSVLSSRTSWLPWLLTSEEKTWLVYSLKRRGDKDICSPYKHNGFCCCFFKFKCFVWNPWLPNPVIERGTNYKQKMEMLAR